MHSHRKQFDEFVHLTSDARDAARLRRDYRDNKQWTAEQVATLRDREQSPIVINKFAQKIDFMLGAEQNQRTDPRCYARTPGHEQAAEALTDALRFIDQRSDLDYTFTDCFEDRLVEGVEACVVEMESLGGELWVSPRRIPYRRFYYDPHSSRKDFSDATYMGILTWVDQSQLMRALKNAKRNGIKVSADDDDIAHLFDEGEDEDLEDKPDLGHNKDRKRVRFMRHYFVDDDGLWNRAYFSGDLILIPEALSPFVDQYGEPECPIIAESAHVDRENQRYATSEYWMGPQQEINHRRSKMLHMLSTTRAWANPGVIADRGAFLRNIRKGVALLDQPEGKFGEDWGLLPNTEFGQGQALVLQLAQDEFDTFGPGSAAQGNDQRTLSGDAFQQLQRGSMISQNNDADGHRKFKLDVWRACANRIKQFWTEERWIRVTDDEKNTRFVGLNQRVTRRNQFDEAIASNPNIPANNLDEAMQVLGMAQTPVVQFALRQSGVTDQMGRLDEVVEVRNRTEDLDVDVILEDQPDVMSLQQEEFETLASLAQGRPELFELLLELAPSIRTERKERVLEKLSGSEQNPALQAMQQLQMQQAEAEIQKTKSEAIRNTTQAAENTASAQRQYTEAQTGTNL